MDTVGSTGSKQSKNHGVSYGLHSSDQPGVSLVNVMLDGRNYLSWSIAVRTALEAKKKVGFIDGTIKAPEDQEEYAEWKSVDSMIKSWIVNSIANEISDTFVYCHTSKALWDILEERFGVSNAPRLYQVQRQTNLLRQGGDSITVYYNKIHKCWDELDRIMPTPTCTCGKCTCDMKRKVADIMASTKLLQFLMGLNPIYDVVRTQILNLDPLPPVNKAFHMVVTDEAQREVNMTCSGPAEDNSAMAVKAFQTKNEGNGFKRKDSSKKDKFCDHCKVNGHTRETCFKIHGYPEWFKELREKRAGKKPVAAVAQDSSTKDTPITQESDLSSKGELANAISYLLKEVQRLGKGKASSSKDEQVNFANLYDFAGKALNQNLFKFTYDHWIIDTGATTHMCCNKDLMFDLELITKNRTVHLPDKSTKQVHSMGKEQKSNHLLAKGRELGGLYYLDKGDSPKCDRNLCLKCKELNSSDCKNLALQNKRDSNSTGTPIWKDLPLPNVPINADLGTSTAQNPLDIRNEPAAAHETLPQEPMDNDNSLEDHGQIPELVQDQHEDTRPSSIKKSIQATQLSFDSLF
ncbi:uncharacterized protein G2W53_028181 [Senna tora]|uniref:Retrotransposon Copia-like N-terminal domain-containing protein n=1 Tax=Senna tora TaxID=362788 RepID=A0A834T337_9FABA|nr:uncharacterized protein G2W53_028181 [Senna tora]